MNRFAILSVTIFITTLLGGVYGIVHDEITYSISREYFTKFKYQQFAIDPATFGGDRYAVGVIGFLATWWVGFFIGLVIGVTALFYRNPVIMKKGIKKAIAIVFGSAVLLAIVGYFRGRYYLSTTGVDWWLPEDLDNKTAFITVGSIHNYSYLGGGIGILLAILFILISKKSANNENPLTIPL